MASRFPLVLVNGNLSELPAGDTLSVVLPAPPHNDLAGLQGGAAGEYYHLTAAQATDVSNLSSSLSGKQASLVSGTNIKTINNTSLLGSGNIALNSDSIALRNVGAGVAELLTVTDMADHFLTGAVVNGCGATDNGNGTFSIASGEVMIRDAASDHSSLHTFALSAAGPFTPADNDVTYYYIDYNGGNPVWASGISTSDYNGQNKMQAYSVARQGTRLFIIDARGQSLDGNRKVRRLLLETSGANQNGYWHTRGGSVLAASGLALSVTQGKFYYGLAPIAHTAFDTTVAGTADANVFDYYYARNNWTYTANSKTINSTQYDNAGTLSNLVAGRYRTDWVYLVLSAGTPKLVVVMGNAQHASLAEAQAATMPASIPAWMDGASVLLGQAVVLKGATTLTIQSAFNTGFTGSPTATHNDLGALQGGAAGEYYHLTAAQATDVSNLSSSLSGKQATLVSGSNIKTINGSSILGSGDINIGGGTGSASGFEQSFLLMGA